MSDQSPVKVLIVDDSAMVRSALRQVLSGDPGIEVVAALSNGAQAWDWLQSNRPDVITLDLNMPQSDGFSLLRKMMPVMPIPVVVISSLTQAGTEATMAAMEAGAVDVIEKPRLHGDGGIKTAMDDLRRRVLAAAQANPAVGLSRTTRSLSDLMARNRPVVSAARYRSNAVIAIGASTGGVQALSTILPMFPANAPGIVLVQHMPEGFTHAFASRLNRTCEVNVVEAQDGEVVQQGKVLLAPGGTRHMRLERIPTGGYRVVLAEGDKVCFSRPSVDVLFNSVAQVVGRNAVGAILTGMGRDGAAGMLAMRRAGAFTVAQDEETCVVFGMPQAAWRLGSTDTLMPLDDIPARLLQAVTLNDENGTIAATGTH